jgi:hypothetical protein
MLKIIFHFCNTIMLLPPAGVHRESSCKIVQMTTVPSSVEIKAFFTLLVNSSLATQMKIQGAYVSIHCSGGHI